jgi:hypothetical protein
MLTLLRHSRLATALGTAGLALLSVLPTSAAKAEDMHFFTGDQLLSTCSSGANNNYCYGYVLGAYDTAIGGAASICLSSDAREAQMLDIVLKYLRHHPDSRSEIGGTAVVDALSDAYPC